MVTARQAKRLRVPLAERPERLIEVVTYPGGPREVFRVYPEAALAAYSDAHLYHMVLAVEAIARLRPTAWSIPHRGGLTIPDAHLLFPWGEALLEVDTGHYSIEAVVAKLRAFRTDRLYWASTRRERLKWVLDLARKLGKPVTPLLVPPVV